MRREKIVQVVKAEGEIDPFPCGVYLIAPVRGLWPVKVGVSVDPIERLKSLQISHWEVLAIARFWYVRSRALAFRLETLAHRMLEDKAMLGEWFDIDVAAAEKVVKRAADNAGINIREMSGGKRFERHAGKFLNR